MSFKPIYKLLDWIPKDKIIWYSLLSNPNAIQLIEKELFNKNNEWIENNKDITFDKYVKLAESKDICNNSLFKIYNTNIHIKLRDQHEEEYEYKHADIDDNVPQNGYISRICHDYDDYEYNEWRRDPSRYEFYRIYDYYESMWIKLASNPNAIDLLYKFFYYNKFFDYEKKIFDFDFRDPFSKKLCKNPNAIDLLRKYEELIDLEYLCKNPNGIEIIEEYYNDFFFLNFKYLARNPNAIPIIKKYPNKFCWEEISYNENFLSLLNIEECMEWPLFYWKGLSRNPNAIELLRKYEEFIDWEELSRNKNAIELLKENFEKIDWEYVCFNENFNQLIDSFPDKLDIILEKIDWFFLSKNINAVEFLRNYQDKIDWRNFSGNPSIFKLDYKEMRDQCMDFAEELAAYVFHPDRISRISKSYGIEFDELLEVY